MTPLFVPGVMGCTSERGDEPKGYDTTGSEVCDSDASTADLYTNPQLDALIADYEARAGVTWAATAVCSDGITRTMTFSYTAVGRSEIAVSERVVSGMDPSWEACGWGQAVTPAVIGGDTLTYTGEVVFDIGSSDGRDDYSWFDYDGPTGIRAKFMTVLGGEPQGALYYWPSDTSQRWGCGDPGSWLALAPITEH